MDKLIEEHMKRLNSFYYAEPVGIITYPPEL